MTEGLSDLFLNLKRDAVLEIVERRLIGRVGDDGGLILGSGCGVPTDVNLENFRAMIETGKNTKA